MGTYLNPGNGGFARIANNEYVDKTGMIGLLNKAIGTTKNLTCISRPRRFGKSYAAQMLCAYYDATCDSHELFEKYSISKDPSYEQHLNKYHVIDLDITNFISESRKEGLSLREIPMQISDALRREVEEILPDVTKKKSLNDVLIELVNRTGKKIVFVLDEWDSIIREPDTDEEAQRRYLNLLRGWFKNNNFTPKAVAAAYMTGILPIKKDSSQSAISDFQEYSMLDPQDFAVYVGFTEEEVQKLCRLHGRNFTAIKRWYDGYTVGDRHSVYNPYSVMQALDTGKIKSYWKKTSAAEALMTYIDMDQDGLQEDIARLIAGESIVVDPDFFQNDVKTFTCKDDVLTLLIHLGYLTYEEVTDSYDDDEEDVLTGLAWIPNEEVRSEFDMILRKAKHKSLVELVRKSDQLLRDTIAGNAERVAAAIQDVHDSSYAPTFYNHEQSLRYVVKMAYISCVDQYARMEELPSGHGIADVVFLPKRRSTLPAIIVELKWNREAEGAIAQVQDRNYPKALEHFGGEVILVGISYDAGRKKHTCVIKRHKKSDQ